MSREVRSTKYTSFVYCWLKGSVWCWRWAWYSQCFLERPDIYQLLLTTSIIHSGTLKLNKITYSRVKTIYSYRIKLESENAYVEPHLEKEKLYNQKKYKTVKWWLWNKCYPSLVASRDGILFHLAISSDVYWRLLKKKWEKKIGCNGCLGNIVHLVCRICLL